MAKILNGNGNIVEIPDGDTRVIETLLLMGCKLVSGGEGFKSSGKVIEKNQGIEVLELPDFELFAPFDELLRRYPEAQNADEMFAVAKETIGFERFTLQDAESCMIYRVEKERVLRRQRDVVNNSHNPSSKKR